MGGGVGGGGGGVAPICLAEAAKVFKKTLVVRRRGDEIRPEMLKALDIVGLSWLTRLFNVAWGSGSVPLDRQTGVVVPIFKKRDGECDRTIVISHYAASGESLCQGAERSSDSWSNLRFKTSCTDSMPVVELWTSSLPSQEYSRGPGSLPNQTTCALWTWIRLSTGSLWDCCGGCCGSLGFRTCCNGPSGPSTPAVRAVFGLFALSQTRSRCVSASDRAALHYRSCLGFSWTGYLSAAWWWRSGLGVEQVRFGGLRISSLLFADDVVLLSSDRDLQHSLGPLEPSVKRRDESQHLHI